MNILTTNCFLKDFEDPNPFVRRLVIKTVCHIPCLHDLAFELIPLALCDTNSYVRSTAVTSCTLIVNEENLESKQNIIDKLYDMIRDPDPTVVSSSLSVLDVILYSEGGVVINARLAKYLISRLSEFQEWHFATVCKVLKKYVPKSNEELIIILNALDENLSDLNPLIFTTASDLALFYTEVALKETFSSDIIEQISPQMKFLFCHGNDEVLWEILKMIQQYAIKHKRHFSLLYKFLFCRYSEPIFIKVQKLQIITDLGNSSNFSEVAEELLLNSCNCIKQIAVQSINSFIKFFLVHPVSSNVVESFAQLLDIQYNDLNEEILIALCSSKLEEREDFRHIFLPTISKISSNVFSEKGKLAFLKLIGNYGKYIERSPYVIEDLLNCSENVKNENIMMMIIIASVKLFLVRPAEMQLLLGRVLQLGEHSDNLLLRKQCAIYYHLLNDTALSNEILLAHSQSENVETKSKVLS